jgi:hypothetical protein
MDVNGLLTNLVLGNTDANMHHQLNDATVTVSASCTISTSVKPELRRGWKGNAIIRNDQLNSADLTFTHCSLPFPLSTCIIFV